MTRPRRYALRARREAVVDLWRQGHSAAVIAIRLGLAVITVKNDVTRARKANPDAVPRRYALRARREAVVDLWRQGHSAGVIATRLGLAVITVQNDVTRARKANPDAAPRRHPGPLTAAQCAKILALKAEGERHSTIARAVDVNHMSVVRVLRKAGVAEVTSNPRPVAGAIGSQIVAMWEAGHTGRAIADGLGLASVGKVYNTIGRMAPELRRQKGRRARGQSTVQQVAALRRQRRSNREIAHELGTTRALVEYYVRRGVASGAIARRQRVVSVAEAREIITLNAAGGISCREIARRFSVHIDTVYRILRIAGVAPSSVTRRQRLKPKILALWEAGWKSEVIARLNGVTPDYVRGVARRAAMKNPAFRRQAPPLSAAEIERIGALRRDSYCSCAEIAELVDVCHGAVQRIIRELARSEPGLALDRGPIAKNRLPEVMLLMAQGFRPAVIAERFGVDRASMYRLLFRLRRQAKSRGGLFGARVESGIPDLPQGS